MNSRKALVFALLSLQVSSPRAETGLVSESQAQRRVNHELTIGTSVALDSMDPRSAWHNIHFLMVQLFTRTLVRLDSSGSVRAGLASSWAISPDGREYTFKLQEGARFSDGSPVRSEDVAYSLSRHFWPDSTSIIKEFLHGILVGKERPREGQFLPAISTPNARTLVVKLLNPYPPFLEVLSMPGFGVIKRGSGESAEPIGSGLMRAEYRKADREWIFKRTGAETGGARTISIRQFAGDEAILAAIERKRVDLAMGFTLGQLSSRELPESYERVRAYSPGTLHLYVNDRAEFMKSKEFRQALRDLLQEAASKVPQPGFYIEPLNTLLPRGFMPPAYYRRPAKDMTPEKFVKLFGLQKGRHLDVVLRKEYVSPALEGALRDALARAGFDARVVLKKIAEAHADFKSGEYDLAMGGYFASITDADGFLPPLLPTNALRFGKFPAGSLVQRVAGARFIKSTEQRRARYLEIVSDFEEEAYVVPLFRLHFPLLASTALLLPDTNFRYDLNLSKIDWKPQ